MDYGHSGATNHTHPFTGIPDVSDFRQRTQTETILHSNSQRQSWSALLRTMVLATQSLLTIASADDWPHWRGALRNDVSAEESGWDGGSWAVQPVWQTRVGEGSSSPLVVGDCVYLTGWSDEQDTLFCLNLATGKQIWKQSYDAPRYGRFSIGDKALYSGPCSTPESDDDTAYLFTLGIDGALSAWNTAASGRRVWSRQLYEEYGAQQRPEVAERRKTQRDYGYIGSPLVTGNQLIVEVGGSTGNIVGFDKRTGEQRWTSKNRDEAGHTGGPVLIVVEGSLCVAVLTLRNLVVTAVEGPSVGETIAHYPWTTDFGNNVATPAVHEDSVLITSAYNHFAMCRLRITHRGAEKVWENTMASGVCSPLIHDGHVYWAWRGIHCVDFETGQEQWSGGNIAAQGSCILTADDRLIVYGNKGDLLLTETARRSPDKYTQLASKSVFSEADAWPHVVLAHGYLICRDRAGNVCCYSTSEHNH